MSNQILIICLGLLFAKMAARQSPIPSPYSGRVVPREFSMDQLRNQCIEFTEVRNGDEPEDFRDCRVSEFAEFGSVDGQTYYYALYCLIPSYEKDGSQCGDGSFNARFHRQRGVAIFTQDRPGGGAMLLFERADSEIGLMRYEKPEIIPGADGAVLYLPIALDGTGVGNESEYYLREKGEWQPIEAKEWLNDLLQRIPQGLQIWKGVWPDLHTLRAEAGLYRAGDANCCPTGGAVQVQLAIRSRQFVIESVRFKSPE